MKDVIKKYAKDINRGDKIQKYPFGWLEVIGVSKSRFEYDGVEITFCNGLTDVYNRHSVFDYVLIM